jgi:hypothetical protein
LLPSVRPAVTSAGMLIPFSTLDCSASVACRANERPVSAFSASSAAAAKVLDSATQPGEAGVDAGGV